MDQIGLNPQEMITVNTSIIAIYTKHEQAHLEFQKLMQSIAESVSDMWADARSEADRDAVREFELEISDAACTTTYIYERIDNVKQVIEKRGIKIA